MEYKRTSDYKVDAMQLLLCDLTEIKDWLDQQGIEFTINKENIELHLKYRRNLIAYIRDYIVIHGKTVIIYDEETFEENFEESEE